MEDVGMHCVAMLFFNSICPSFNKSFSKEKLTITLYFLLLISYSQRINKLLSIPRASYHFPMIKRSISSREEASE